MAKTIKQIEKEISEQKTKVRFEKKRQAFRRRKDAAKAELRRLKTRKIRRVGSALLAGVREGARALSAGQVEVKSGSAKVKKVTRKAFGKKLPKLVKKAPLNPEFERLLLGK